MSRGKMVHIGAALDALLAQKLAEASVLRGYGHEREAVNLERLVEEVRRAINADADRPVTIPEAAELSGFHPDTIRHKIAAGELENVGRKHSPLVRVGSLPAKAGRQVASGYDPAADALSLASRRP